MAVTVGNRRCA